MEENKMSETENKVATDATNAPSQDILEKELAKIEDKKQTRTRLEKMIYTRNKLDREIKEAKGDEIVEEENDDVPMTRAEYKRLEAEKASKTALDLTDEIKDDKERELVKYHLQNSIKSTGNPQEDLKLSRAIVNSVKNTQLAELAGKKGTAKTHSSGSGSPAKGEETFTPTAEELTYMKPPFNVSKEKILEARKEVEGQE